MKFNKTKIIATIGPATYSKEVLDELVSEGTNVCRLNFSHGSYEEYDQVIRAIRDISKEKNINIGILADLQGPKLRIGEIEGGSIDLKEGERIIITSKELKGSNKKLYVNYPNLSSELKENDPILINDGKIRLRVQETHPEEVTAIIEQGGELTSKKGVNLPNTGLSLPSLTEKDLNDLDFALKNQIEWIALSFVRSSQDIKDLKSLISKKRKKAKVIAKIEKPQALDDIESIIKVADGIMVARGDLGVEVPLHSLPLIQKRIVAKSRIHSKPVIIATQMMESMMQNLTPSRAEVNDVANAVMDGADAVMLSGETSVGKYPVEVIKTIYKIIDNAETYEDLYYKMNVLNLSSNRDISDSICQNAIKLARDTKAKAIVTMSFSGYTGFKISSFRPKANTFVFTANRPILNMLSLLWGVRGFYYNKFVSTDDTINDIMGKLENEGLINKDDLIINIASMPIRGKGKSNMLKLSRVE